MNKILQGRPLLVIGNDVYYSIKNRLYCLNSFGTTHLGNLPMRSIALNFTPRIFDRLLRNEVSHLRLLHDGSFLAVAKYGFHHKQGEGKFSLKYAFQRGSRPLGLSIENDNWMVFGEYGTLNKNQPVHILAAQYPSFDFSPVFSFPPGKVKHVHNVIWDAYDGCYWILVGDSNSESGIMRLSRDFSQFSWLISGGQIARAVNLIVEKDYLIYGMDSEREENYIIRLNKKTGIPEKLCKTEGSSLFCAKFGDDYYISTTVEPSNVNHSSNSCLLKSKDGMNWSQVLQYKKDLLNPTYFQFGTIVLPFTQSAQNLVYGGQAIIKIDGKTVIE